MSLIFGILRYDASIDENFFRSMHTPLKSFPQDKSKIIFENEAAFGKILRYSTPEDVYDNQPVYLSEPNILFVGQGRVDNREELRQNLGLRAIDEISDSYFILQAYLKFGEQTQHKIKGDWSFAAYHYGTQELFIARDTMGYTPMFFLNTEKYFAFSSSIKSILALPDFRNELNEEYFASTISLWRREEKFLSYETFFRNIYQLQNGHTLKLKRRKEYISRYWPPENIKEIHYKNKQDYADVMLSHMYNAVKVRLRSYKPVASMLSGGLDSSTVSYIAADLLKQQNKTLTTFSHVPIFKKELELAPLGKKILDETPFIRAIVESSGNINPQYLNTAHISPFQGNEECMKVIDGFIHGASNSNWMIDIYSTSAKQGFGTILTGEGGNGSTSFSGVDYLHPHSFRSFIRNPYNYLKIKIAKPIALKYAKNFFWKNSLENYASNGYLSIELMTKLGILSDMRNNEDNFVEYYSDVSIRKRLFIDLYTLRSVFGGACGNYYGIELRDPTCDVDVMNFFLAIPNEAFFDEDFNGRWLVKRMMKNRLPTNVLHAKKKGLQSADIFFKMQASKEELLNAFEMFRNNPLIRNYIDIAKLESDLKTSLSSDKMVQPINVRTIIKTMQATSFLNAYFNVYTNPIK